MSKAIQPLALLALAAAVYLHAQSPYGRILGRITDASGAVVPGASVRAVNTETNVAISAASNAEGIYELPNLPPGQYRIEARLQGFKQYIRGPIELRVSDVLEVVMAMEVGDMAENITVSAEAPLLESSSAGLGQVMDTRRIVELPLAGGNPMYLTQLAPGVAQTTSPGHGWLPQATGPISNAVVAGTSNGTSEFTIDGIPNMARGGLIAFAPPPEMVQEFRVETAPFDAAVGHFTGGVINMVLKSGTNKFRGNLFFSHVSRPLMTRTFFVNRDNSLWPFVRTNRYRATWGGPVYLPRLYDGRNRTFWTFGFDWLDRLRPEQAAFTVPTLKQRSGDFSDLLALGARYAIYDPATITPVPGGHWSSTPFAGNVIPANRLDAMARKLIGYYPAPNTVPATLDGQRNYTDPLVRTIDYKSQIVRVDHQFSQNHRGYASLSRYRAIELFNRAFHNEANGLKSHRLHHSLALDDVVTLSPALVLNLRYGLVRLPTSRGPQVMPFDLLQLGFPQALVSQLEPGRTAFPIITVDGNAFTRLGDDTLAETRTTRHVFSGMVSHLRGSHSLRFGSEHRVFQANDASLGNVSPLIAFTSTWTRRTDTEAGAPLGQGLASFLLGIPAGGSIDKNDTSALQSGFFGLFLQDDWKLTPSLTVNLGLRWEVERPIAERYNRMNWDFDARVANPIQDAAKANYARSEIPELPAERFQTLGGILFAGVKGAPRTLREADRNNVAPRIGLAYRLVKDTVLRLGYAVFFDFQNEDPGVVYQQGFSQATPLVPTEDNGATFRARLANPFPDPLLKPAGAARGLRTYLGQQLNFTSPGQRAGYMQRWSFSLQRQWPGRVVAEIGYLGNRSTGLAIAEQFNATPAQYLSTSPVRDLPTITRLRAQVPNPFANLPDLAASNLRGAVVAKAQLLSPYPHFVGIGTRMNSGFAWYHGLLFRADRRFGNGFTLQGSYTWSKAMEAVQKLNPTDAHPHHVISTLDRPHHFTASGIFEFPFGRGRRWLSSPPGWLNHLTGGWSAQSIYMFQSGPPITFPNVIFMGDIKDIPLSSDQRSVERWFNTNAGFERDSAKQLEFNIRTFPLRLSGVRAAGYSNVDLAAFKTFSLTERLKLQLRGEAQNAMNHALFPAAPNASPATLLFGQITQGDVEQRRITIALKLFW